MNVERLGDPDRFLTEAEALLLEDEPRHNLIIGLAQTIRSNPAAYPEHAFWLVRRDDDVVGAALRTPPNNLVLARPRDASALPALAKQIDESLPGVIGAVPEVDGFASAWCEHRRVSSRVVFEQGVFVLRQLAPVPRARGAFRDATPKDIPLLAEWHDAFTREALGEPLSAEHHLRQVRTRLDTPHAGFGLWECDGNAVSLCGFGGPTPHGIRIGPVYTPPELRGHGYATSLTAEVSSRLLNGGRRFCFLYTNLANPTSNAIYQRIGYVRVCESRQISFRP
jgi:hypothetical protein